MVKQPVCCGFVIVTGFTFHLGIKKTVDAYDVPNDLFIDIDKTPLLFVLMCKYALYKANKKFAPISNNSVNHQITGTFPGTLVLFRIIYVGEASHCFTKFSFQSEFNETHYFISYVTKVGKGLGPVSANQVILIIDNYEEQWTEPVEKDNCR